MEAKTMRKLSLIFTILLLIIFQQIFVFNSKANEAEIVYLYTDEFKIAENVLEEIENNNININKININKLDNLKYYFQYQEAYGIDDDKFPIILFLMHLTN